MWSGPRNISTAMLRAWENRDDTWVCDEPLYAHYLRRTGRPHPGAEEVMARHEGDWRAVTAALVGPIPHGRRIYYQKQMAHHLLPEIERAWLDRCRHAFLIRSPRQMLASLARHFPQPSLADTGLPQQWEIFERVSDKNGSAPPVIDSRDVLTDPRGQLRALCEALELPFSESMLSWPSGPRATDGSWARHWYDEVRQTTGFRPYRDKPTRLAPELEPLLALCMPYYERLYRQRLVSCNMKPN